MGWVSDWLGDPGFLRRGDQGLNTREDTDSGQVVQPGSGEWEQVDAGDGATINCEGVPGSCPTVFYMDDDASDGLFGSGSTPNTGTQGAAEAVFVIPDSALTYYVASHADYTFSREIFGSVDGVIAVLSFVGR